MSSSQTPKSPDPHRPSKLTLEKQKQLLQAILEGGGLYKFSVAGLFFGEQAQEFGGTVRVILTFFLIFWFHSTPLADPLFSYVAETHTPWTSLC